MRPWNKGLKTGPQRDAELIALGYNVVRISGAAIKRDASAALKQALED